MAYVASNFVFPRTTTFLQSLLDNNTGDYLAGIATWADSIRYTKWGRFTSDFHFIDAKDSPPQYCGVDFDRDCKKDRGCVVSALHNYTTRLLDPRQSAAERAIAAKFVVHFIGDIHQPLHTENVERGGNGIQVLFDGRGFNLHHVWDTSILEKSVGGVPRSPYAKAKQWADQLTREINAGKYASKRIDWLRSANLSDPVATAMAWATEGNALVCTHGECWPSRVLILQRRRLTNNSLPLSQSSPTAQQPSEIRKSAPRPRTTRPRPRCWRCRLRGQDTDWRPGWT